MKTITTPQGKIIVDESAEIKGSDWFYNDWCKGISINQYPHEADLNNYSEAIHLPDNQFLQNKSNCYKVIATINHSISLDVPMVIVEDEVEKQWLIFYKDWLMKNSGVKVLTAPDRVMFNAGYKAAQQKGVYSEEDLRKSYNYGKIPKAIFYLKDGGKETVETSFDKFIQYLKQEYIELDMEEIPLNSDGSNYQLVIKTNRVNGQLMAYKK